MIYCQVISDLCIDLRRAQRPKPHTGPSEADVNLENEHEYRQENEREKSRLYLSKCSQEVAYHVIPSSHPPPELGEQDLRGCFVTAVRARADP